MAYHVSLINSCKKDVSSKVIYHKERFQKFLVQEFNMAVEFDDKGNVECFYDKEDPSFTIFYTEGIEGEYYINTTDDNHIERLIAIAHKLNDGTRVRGDEGETYNSLEDVYIHPDDIKTETVLSFHKKIKIWIKSNIYLIIWGVISFIVLMHKMGVF